MERSTFLRDALAAVLDRLGLSPAAGAGLPPHVTPYPRRKDNDLHLTLLNYIPSRKSMAIDVIETGLSFAGQTLRLDTETLTHWPSGAPLSRDPSGGWLLPAGATGRLLLRAPDHFAQTR